MLKYTVFGNAIYMDLPFARCDKVPRSSVTATNLYYYELSIQGDSRNIWERQHIAQLIENLK